MVVTVAIVVATHNLALGVAGGVVLAAVFFARRVAHLADVTSVLDPDDGRTRIYHVTGELFFASTNELLHLFDYADDIDGAVIDLNDAHIWDTSAVAALDAVVAKFAAHGIEATLIGLNEHSAAAPRPHHRLARLVALIRCVPCPSTADSEEPHDHRRHPPDRRGRRSRRACRCARSATGTRSASSRRRAGPPGGFRLYTDHDIERLHLVKSLKPLDLSLDEMRDLLTTRDRLETGESTTAERDRLRGRLASFSAVAAERCGRLRAQLAAVEQATQVLTAEPHDRGAEG